MGVTDLVRVLVADDDEEILTLVTLVMKGAGYDVVVARNGTEALTVALERLPDLAVLDLMMPGLDGYDVTRMMRADRRTRDVPVLLLTALSSGYDVKRGFEAGADDYMRKPFSTDELEARCAALLERRRLIERLVEQAEV